MARITGLNQCPPLPLFVFEAFGTAPHFRSNRFSTLSRATTHCDVRIVFYDSSGFWRKRLCYCTQTLVFELYTGSIFFVCYEMRSLRCGRLRAPLAVTL